MSAPYGLLSADSSINNFGNNSGKRFLLHSKEFTYLAAVCLLKDCKLVEVTLLLLSLLGENVAVISVFSLDFTRSGKSESFFRTGVRLYFWHVFNCLIVINKRCCALYQRHRHLFLFTLQFSQQVLREREQPLSSQSWEREPCPSWAGQHPSSG